MMTEQLILTTLSSLLETVTRIEKKMDQLLQPFTIDREPVPLVSNDPTEIESLKELNMLHSFVPEAILGETPQFLCSDCGVRLSDCGATTASWYCT